MATSTRFLAVLGLFSLALGTSPAEASFGRARRDAIVGGTSFVLQRTSVGAPRPPESAPRLASLAGGPLALFRGDAIVVDDDSGMLVRTDAHGRPLASLEIGPGAAQVVVDEARARAYVSDRNGDGVVVVDLERGGLVSQARWPTPAEPYGLALVPDGSLLLVTTVADRTVVGISTERGERGFELSVGPEPRGIAVRPDGRAAVITFLTMGVVGHLDLDLASPSAVPHVRYTSLDDAPPSPPSAGLGLGMSGTSHRSRRLGFSVHVSTAGPSVSRGAFAATYVGHGIAVVPHHLSTPKMSEIPTSSGYGGGGSAAPIRHRLAFLAPPVGEHDAARLGLSDVSTHQPRALAYAADDDTLYVAGYGSDDVIAIANVSQASAELAWARSVALDRGTPCGPTGIALDESTHELVVFCALERRLARLSTEGDRMADPPRVVMGEALATSRLSRAAQRGREVFRRGNSTKISTQGALACASCHPEGRTDALSWFLEGNVLQTPVLAGRLVGAQPFKWDAQDPNLGRSLTNTVRRLGGTGLSAREIADLQAYLVTLVPPRPPTAEDPRAVARGRVLFESDTTGCAACHTGPLLTDRKQYAIAADLRVVDTPSLLGLATSAPYYHDGSAPTLRAVLEDKGTVHGMGRTSRLTAAEIDDLTAYLASL